jgi:coatomer protein complex subunit gamma
VTVSDHVQKVLKPNWSASWEEIGGENELEDTYTLSIPTLEGFLFNSDVFFCSISIF